MSWYGKIPYIFKVVKFGKLSKFVQALQWDIKSMYQILHTLPDYIQGEISDTFSVSTRTITFTFDFSQALVSNEVFRPLHGYALYLVQSSKMINIFSFINI